MLINSSTGQEPKSSFIPFGHHHSIPQRVAANQEFTLDRRAGSTSTGSLQRQRLGMQFARFRMPAFAEDNAVAHDHATDARVRRRGVQPLRGELQRAGHMLVIFRFEHLSIGHRNQRPPAVYLARTGRRTSLIASVKSSTP